MNNKQNAGRKITANHDKSTYPLLPRRMLLTTSLTPLFKHLCSAAETPNSKNANRFRKKKNTQIVVMVSLRREPRRTSLRVRLQSFLPASGLAMGASAAIFFFSLSFCAVLSVSLSLPISHCLCLPAIEVGFWGLFSDGGGTSRVLGQQC